MDIFKMAEGFLKIAVENMANAIKKISIQKGYDVTNYMLNCFGGAGGQHACNVADSLGISNVMIHPYAGVLSAYGMGLAEIRSIREGHFEKNITNILDADNLIEILSSQAKKDLNDQDISDASIILLKNAFLHYKGSHQNLEIKFDTPENMRKSFEQEHKKRFGFFVEDREIFIEMLTVEAVGKKTENYDFLNPNTSTTKANPIAFKKMYVNGSEINTPIYKRDELIIGQNISGPAIIVEATGTNIIDAGWSGTLDKHYNLILSRVEEKKLLKGIGTSVDVVMLEVFNNLFMNIAEQMGATLANTCLLYTSPSPRDRTRSRMPSSA